MNRSVRTVPKHLLIYIRPLSKARSIQTVVKADRKLLQRLLTASIAGRDVEMENILKYELSPMPLSLAKPSSEKNETQKSMMLQLLTSHLETPQNEKFQVQIWQLV